MDPWYEPWKCEEFTAEDGSRFVRAFFDWGSLLGPIMEPPLPADAYAVKRWYDIRSLSDVFDYKLPPAKAKAL